MCCSFCANCFWCCQKCQPHLALTWHNIHHKWLFDISNESLMFSVLMISACETLEMALLHTISNHKFVRYKVAHKRLWMHSDMHYYSCGCLFIFVLCVYERSIQANTCYAVMMHFRQQNRCKEYEWISQKCPWHQSAIQKCWEFENMVKCVRVECDLYLPLKNGYEHNI